MTSNKHKFTDN